MNIDLYEELGRISINDNDVIQHAEFHLEKVRSDAIRGLSTTLKLIESSGNIDIDPESDDLAPEAYNPDFHYNAVSAVDRANGLVCKLVTVSEAIALIHGLRRN